MSMKISPLAPKDQDAPSGVSGVLVSTIEAGLKYKNRPDVLLVALQEGTQVAGVFTKSKTASAPVKLGREFLKNGTARALLVNAGNANAFTGKVGMDASLTCIKELSAKLKCREEEVFVCSTGVIGEELNPQTITQHFDALISGLSGEGWQDAARAIMTTDTFTKTASKIVETEDGPVSLTAIAKGSGMIAPDMATMLAYIFTDGQISSDELQALLSKSADKSFNAITVDSDTSTSDTVLAFATGASDIEVGAGSPHQDIFAGAFDEVMLDLAHQIVKDGEGATKFISIEVSGAESDMAAKKIGLSVANSPLVKTAIAGEDANWGRIVMAVGKAGEEADRDAMSIWIGGVRVAKDGAQDPGYDEREVVPHLKGTHIEIKVDVGVGDGQFQVWTCDLTHGYIDINADYRS